MPAAVIASCKRRPGATLPQAIQVRVRVSTMLWLYAILASAMATFATVEEYACAFACLCTWLAAIDKVGKQSRLRFTRQELLACLLMLGSVSALSYPALSQSFQTERVSECRRKMERISLALMEYKSKHKTLPPARVSQLDGADYSWRASIAPFLNTLECLHASLDESDHICPSHIFSGSQFGSSASYFAVTGAGTAWDTWQSKQGKIGDDPAETLLLLEEPGRGFDWKKPRDLDFNEAFQLLTQPVGSRYVHLSPGEPGYFEKPNPNRGAEGVNAAFADGRVRFIPLPLSEELATALLTAHGGEVISPSEKNQLWSKQLDYGKVYSFGLFVLLCLMPSWRLFKLSPHLHRYMRARSLHVRKRLAGILIGVLKREAD